MTLHRFTFLFPVILNFRNPPEPHHLFYCASSSTSSTILFHLPHHPHPPAPICNIISRQRAQEAPQERQLQYEMSFPAKGRKRRRRIPAPVPAPASNGHFGHAVSFGKEGGGELKRGAALSWSRQGRGHEAPVSQPGLAIIAGGRGLMARGLISPQGYKSAGGGLLQRSEEKRRMRLRREFTTEFTTIESGKE